MTTTDLEWEPARPGRNHGPVTFDRWVADQLGTIRAAGQWREVRTIDAHGPCGVLAGRDVVSFASNDYLGLSTHPTVIAAAHAAIDRWGTGSTASRLVVGSRPVHEDLEACLARWKGTQRALLFPSGYGANLGVLQVLGGPDCTIVSDELNHASIIDGCRLSRSRVVVSRHADVDHVDAILTASETERAIVVTDSVFSMDGDEAPLAALADCCARHGAVLVLDDAHAVLGPDPAALATLPEELLVRVVTLSKALGSLGGAVCGPRAVIDLLVNRARTSIFTTGSSPADAAAATAAIGVLSTPDGAARIARLRAVVDRVAPGNPSPIVPLVVGSEADAVKASDALLARGLLVPAIRPPTVAPGTSRLRMALSAAHTDAMIDALLAALEDLGLAP